MNLQKTLVRYALFAFLTPIPVLSAAASGRTTTSPTYVLVSAPFVLDAKTTVPGHTLDSGSYSIRIVDSLSDRSILRVDNSDGKEVATFIGVHNQELDPFVTSHHQGPILWTSAPKGSVALRGFAFSNGNTLEFAYPKAEAAALAKLNAYNVPAIDPESEGRKPDPKLSEEDREVVTLWMLRATRVGPKGDKPAIEARRYVPAPEPQAASAQTQIAKNEVPEELANVRAAASASAVTPTQAPVSQVPASQGPTTRIKTSGIKSRAVAPSLPQTASNLPEIALLMVFLLFAAGSLRMARLRG